MKTGIIILVCISLIASGLKSQNPTRTLLCKLGNSEEIHAGEYSLSLVGNAYRIAYVVGDYNNNRFRFMINDKLIGEFEEMLSSYSASRINYVDLDKENGYVFTYSKDNRWFINNQGKVYGPYQSIQFLYSDEDPNAFAYKIDDKWYQNISGKITGPFSGGTPIANFCVQNKRGDFIFYYYDSEGNNYFNYNNQQLGPFEEVNTTHNLNERGDYSIEYKKNGQWYALVNGKEFGPYYSIQGINFNASGDYMIAAFDYQQQKGIININGKTIVAGGSIEEFVFSSPEKYAYVYASEQGLRWVKYGEQVSGPFNRINSLSLSANGKLSYIYNADNMNYLRNGNELIGPYRYIYVEMYDKDRDVMSYVYGDQQGNTVYMHQGKVIGSEEFDALREIHFGSFTARKGSIFRFNPYNDALEAEINGVTHKLQISYDPECVIINNQMFGKHTPLNTWYNPNSQSFLWFVQEDRELVLYQYNLK